MRPDEVGPSLEPVIRRSLAAGRSSTGDRRAGDGAGGFEEGEEEATFAPVRIGPGRRSVERTLAAVAAAVVLIGLAVAKPWAGEPPTGSAAPGASNLPGVAVESTEPWDEPKGPPNQSDEGGSSGSDPSSEGTLSDLADWWSVLGTDYGFVSGRLVGAEQPAPGVVVSTLTIWRQRPSTVPLVPERLGPDGSPAAVVPVDTTVIGVTVPRADAPSSITVHWQFAGGRTIEVPIRIMPLGDRGIWLIVPFEGGWEPGLYAVRLVGPAGIRWLNVAVASRPVGTGGPILDPAAWSLEAYERGLRRYAYIVEEGDDGARVSSGFVGRRAPLAPRPK
ncbi:MAG TPA: hypothetical protein VNO86_00270 [Candidatus Binatia bacterium]|nr:hypothetical protein [Candidatus Binatia bacterium]